MNERKRTTPKTEIMEADVLLAKGLILDEDINFTIENMIFPTVIFEIFN